MPKNEISDVLDDEAVDALTVGVDDDLGEPDDEDIKNLSEALGDDDDVDADDDDDDVDADDEDEEEAIEVPVGARPSLDDEDDDDEDEELEADLGEILRERLAAEDEVPDDEEEERLTGLASKSAAGVQEKEVTCEGCFLAVRESQLDMRSGEPACPHCGAPLNI